MSRLLAPLFLLLLSFNQVFASNHTGGGTGTNPGGTGTNPGGTGTNPTSITIPNPLGEGATIATLLTRLTDFLVLIAVPILSLMVLIAAFYMLTAGGDEKKFELGKKVLLYAVIGFAILLVSEGLIKLIESILVGDNPTP